MAVKPRWKCSECQKILSSKQSAVSHVKTFHGDSDPCKTISKVIVQVDEQNENIIPTSQPKKGIKRKKKKAYQHISQLSNIFNNNDFVETFSLSKPKKLKPDNFIESDSTPSVAPPAATRPPARASAPGGASLPAVAFPHAGASHPDGSFLSSGGSSAGPSACEPPPPPASASPPHATASSTSAGSPLITEVLHIIAGRLAPVNAGEAGALNDSDSSNTQLILPPPADLRADDGVDLCNEPSGSDIPEVDLETCLPFPINDEEMFEFESSQDSTFNDSTFNFLFRGSDLCDRSSRQEVTAAPAGHHFLSLNFSDPVSSQGPPLSSLTDSRQDPPPTLIDHPVLETPSDLVLDFRAPENPSFMALSRPLVIAAIISLLLYTQ